MYNRRYHKAYWMMEQETTGYGLQQGTPWGSCVLEIKNGNGRLTVTVESLLPLRKGHYGVYAALSAQGKESSAFCGILTPNGNGHGEMQWNFSADNVAEEFLAEDIFAVVVLAEETGQQGLIAPLTAYCQEKQEWRTAVSPKSPKQDITKEVQQEMQKEEEKTAVAELKAAESLYTATAETPMTIAEPPIAAEKTEKMEQTEKMGQTEKTEPQKQEEAASDGLLEEGIHGSFRGLLKKFKKEMNQLEEMGILSAEESRRIQGISEENHDTEEANPIRKEGITERTRTEAKIQLAKNNYVIEKDKQFAMKKEQAEAQEAENQWIFADHPAIYPFGDGEEWVCIQPEELTMLETIPAHWQRDFFYLLPWHRDKHFIAQEKEGSIFIGIPDTYSGEGEKKAKEHGFSTFRPVEGKTDVGYWIGKV